MRIQYIGGRKQFSVSFNRKDYHFNLENNKILATRDQLLVNHIFSLANHHEFQIVESDMVSDKLEDKVVEKSVDKNIEKKHKKYKKEKK